MSDHTQMLKRGEQGSVELVGRRAGLEVEFGICGLTQFPFRSTNLYFQHHSS